MPRTRRVDVAGLLYHVLNRGNARRTLFVTDGDYREFLGLVARAQDRSDMRILSYCLMPNHWHLVLWPEHDGQMSSFVGWLTMTHTQRCHARHSTKGQGHIYQGRYKSHIVQGDEHLLTLCRYVERNPLAAGLVAVAQDWRWSSLAQRMRASGPIVLHEWPVERPMDWADRVNETPGESMATLDECVRRGRPYGGPEWVGATVREHRLESTVRPPHRPAKQTEPNKCSSPKKCS